MRPMTGLTVAYLGGDKRDIYVVKAFLEEGAVVRVLGVPHSDDVTGTQPAKSAKEAVSGAQVVVAPISGVHPDGTLRVSEEPITVDEELIDAMAPGTVFLIGMATPSIIAACGRRGVRIILYIDLDEVAILNSIPSAEGAIQLIIAETPVTIHGARIAVLGMGRTGLTLAHKLAALGAHVTVFARKPGDLARAFVLGLNPCPYSELDAVCATADVVVNTVPSLMLPRRTLERLPKGCFVLDLASTPGGVDFAAARELGINAMLAPGLPGRVAPKTAGEFLARILPRMAKAELDMSGTA